jgi:hypothetical protein
MLSIVQIAITPNPGRVLDRDALRLALTLSAAQAQAAATGRAMRVEATTNGWRFAQRSRSNDPQQPEVLAWEPITADEVFGPKVFESEGAQLSIPIGGGGLGLEPIGYPLTFVITKQELSRTVTSDGGGGFKVVQPE